MFLRVNLQRNMVELLFKQQLPFMVTLKIQNQRNFLNQVMVRIRFQEDGREDD